jgi:creatinine amidohydrolase
VIRSREWGAIVLAGAWGLASVLGAGGCDRREPPPRQGAPVLKPVQTVKGVVLGDKTWLEAELLLTPETVVVIPLGAASKEHGPHLRLDNDLTLATYFRDRVLAQAEVVMLPTVPYHYFPAFLEYPGSTSLRLETARDLIVDIVRSIARHGPRRFYVINTGVSTNRALAPAAAQLLAEDGVLLRYTDLLAVAGPTERELAQQPGGTHADEIETSMLLYIAPDRVDMSKAVLDYHPRGDQGWLTRDPEGAGTYSKTGIWGDPTLATRAKGERVVEAIVAGMLADIEALRGAELSESVSGE